MFDDMFVHKSGLGRAQGTPYEAFDVDDTVTICFTICLFISPDLDGYRAPQKALTLQDPQGLETQIRSHRVMFASKYRLP